MLYISSSKEYPHLGHMCIFGCSSNPCQNAYYFVEKESIAKEALQAKAARRAIFELLAFLRLGIG